MGGPGKISCDGLASKKVSVYFLLIAKMCQFQVRHATGQSPRTSRKGPSAVGVGERRSADDVIDDGRGTTNDVIGLEWRHGVRVEHESHRRDFDRWRHYLLSGKF